MLLPACQAFNRRRGKEGDPTALHRLEASHSRCGVVWYGEGAGKRSSQLDCTPAVGSLGAARGRRRARLLLPFLPTSFVSTASRGDSTLPRPSNDWSRTLYRSVMLQNVPWFAVPHRLLKCSTRFCFRGLRGQNSLSSVPKGVKEAVADGRR